MRALRTLLLFLSALLLSAPAWSEGIVQVLERSQTQRMQAYPAAAPDSDRAAVVRESFARIVGVTSPLRPVQLRVVRGGLNAEAMLGRVIVASESLADLPEGERLMVLAHELGHVELGHWDAMCALYVRHIPGEVRPEATDPDAEALGAEAHRQAWQHEFAADAYGYRAIYRLGFRMDAVYSLMTRSQLQMDSATHPGTRRRVAQLRQIDLRLERSTLQAAVDDD
ncbi:MAG: M48 family metalloprotease [Betaproteobacteria bacterium]